MNKQKTALIILDGWGHGNKPKSDAIRLANTPFIDSLYLQYPNSELITFGEQVGLPEGQMGNSEVGHLNIGAGRIVYQDLAKINKAIKEHTLKDNPTLLKAFAEAKQKNCAFHFMGLLSDGGVHSHIQHLLALCDIALDQGLKEIYLHSFMDGRDTDPIGGAGYLKTLQDHIERTPIKLSTIVGRYYAMDRDNRWERIKLAYDALVKGVGEETENVLQEIKSRYEQGETDEFLKPIICNKVEGRIRDGDVVLFYNFRTDRPREISKVLSQTDMPDFEMKKLKISLYTMTRYDNSFKNVEVLFDKDEIENTLGEYLSANGKSQLRLAETEKYPHVTFFFSGGREQAFANEKRILVPSPKVATYDLKPEMSALEITDLAIESIEKDKPDFVCLNYANTDMVGHTGDFEAAMKAAATVDSCLFNLIKILLQHSYHTLVIADHGNSDYMINEDGSPNTAHTTNMVPCILVSEKYKKAKLKDGKLADIAPTILSMLDLKIPKEMDGLILIAE